MKNIAFAFTGEGRTDHEFLPIIVERTIESLIPYIGGITYNVMQSTQSDEKAKIIDIAAQAYGYHFIVYHVDADYHDTSQAFERHVTPVQEAVEASDSPLNKDILPIVPVRMTEAWMLADFEVYRLFVGRSLNSDSVGFPKTPREVEGIQAPKEKIDRIIGHARSKNRRPIPIADLYEPFARNISLAKLSLIPSYVEFKARLEALLNKLHLV